MRAERNSNSSQLSDFNFHSKRGIAVNKLKIYYYIELNRLLGAPLYELLTRKTSPNLLYCAARLRQPIEIRS